MEGGRTTKAPSGTDAVRRHYKRPAEMAQPRGMSSRRRRWFPNQNKNFYPPPASPLRVSLSSVLRVNLCPPLEPASTEFPLSHLQPRPVTCQARTQHVMPDLPF